ncbi:Trehalose-6-P synthase/phosphatase complex synthase subunit [Vermiconidia calcicola]|uniref:Trehalose-6-P synthase/phosphatase complex synthase subunit n=1 Tax=Vermiconidia calcicola TaxID=1690605 RepID=A0ACC3MQE7_9PEZI|nr:Trehalose-6-P synthase/phosphatase complex synthase subunit [Vermiconidia calcicola]
MTSSDSKRRLIIVSNRLPVGIKRMAEGQYDFSPSSGGLVTGLSGLAKGGVEFLWYGWPGIEVPQEDMSHLKEELLHKHNAVPVLLDQKTADHYYDGYSNSTIWPLFHYQLDKVLFNEDTSAAYRKANQAFADAIAPSLGHGDHVWVHDYHLMLLPLLLRQQAWKMNISVHLGWFLHTPFPETDFFTILPSKTEILDGILGADVVGFQTDEARRHFLSTCSQVLGRSSIDAKILCSGRQVVVGTYPIGVEPSEFHSRLQKDCVQSAIRAMRDNFRGAKIIVGVDRLDYIKGVPQKLYAFDRFLETHPEWVGVAILVQVAVPSRAHLEAHQELKAEIQKLVGEINGKYGKVNYVPVHFLYSSIDPDELTALYAVADVCFISSIRDGMNLVCSEFVACHDQKAIQSSHESISHGTLILSRFTGAASSLDGSLVVNPWDQEECAEALAHAVSIDADEAHERMRKLGDKVEEQTSAHWGASFLCALERVGKVEVLDMEFG